MSYTALYRKFRPSSFDEVKGQDHIVRTLKNQIESGRAGHAYLFCGTRGTGKTSVAKVLAKAVNCEQPVNGAPCNKCSMCKEIAAGASMNVIEIDAASNNGVDNIRQVIEEVAYPPTKGNYKVYIIDEVHMLSIGAFNALLKTLEEPPSYVMFILATTESHKVPVTIMSRCQRYDFKRITRTEIANHLKELAQAEGLEFEDKAFDYIAKQADGSMRDALSLLDQCIAFNFGNALTYEKVLEVLGTVDIGVFYSLLEAVHSGDTTGAIRVIDDIVLYGKELSQFVLDFTWYLRNLMLIGISDDMEEVLDASAESIQDMKKQAQAVEPEFLIRCINRLSELSAVLRTTTQKRVMTEVYIIKLCKPEMEADIEGLTDRVRQLEAKLEGKNFVAVAHSTKNSEYNNDRKPVYEQEKQTPVLQKTEQVEKEASPVQVSNSEPIREKTVQPISPQTQAKTATSSSDIVRSWPKILNTFKGFDRTMLEEASVAMDEDDVLTLAYPKSADFTYNYVQQFGMLDKISEVIKKHFGVSITCRAVLSDGKTNKENNISKLQKLVNVPVEEEN